MNVLEQPEAIAPQGDVAAGAAAAGEVQRIGLLGDEPAHRRSRLGQALRAHDRVAAPDQRVEIEVVGPGELLHPLTSPQTTARR